MYRQLPPLTLLLANIFTVVAGLALIWRFGVGPWTVLAPVLLLVLVYAMLNLGEQLHGDGGYTRLPRQHRRRLLSRALARYLVWAALIGSAWMFYRLEPYYAAETFAVNHWIFERLFYAQLLLGLPYFLLTLSLRHSSREDYYDPAVRLLLILKTLAAGIESGQGLGPLRALFRRRYNLKVVLNLIMRLYFMPALLIQLLPDSQYIIKLMESWDQQDTLLATLFLITAVLWLMDIINAAASYLFESRWLENRSRSIDLTVGGWLVCTMCYAPFNQLTGSMFPFAPEVISYRAEGLLLADQTGLMLMKLLEVVLLSCHVLCNISLGPSVANITLKKLQTRGVYALVRHPGTTTKLLMWLLGSACYRAFWQWRYLAGFLGWALIYVLRALTEERHLKKFPEYRQYMRKVRYRFLPWLF